MSWLPYEPAWYLLIEIRCIKVFYTKVTAMLLFDCLNRMDVLLSFFTPYPNTPLYQKAVECGLPVLETLGDWGDFDQVDFKAPWMSQEYYDLVIKFRNGMPWNSGCDFDEWCEFYSGIMENLMED